MAGAGEVGIGTGVGQGVVLPPEVEVFREFRACEFSTPARDPDHLYRHTPRHLPARSPASPR